MSILPFHNEMIQYLQFQELCLHQCLFWTILITLWKQLCLTKYNQGQQIPNLKQFKFYLSFILVTSKSFEKEKHSKVLYLMKFFTRHIFLTDLKNDCKRIENYEKLKVYNTCICSVFRKYNHSNFSNHKFTINHFY